MITFKNCLLCSSLLTIGFFGPDFLHRDSLPGRGVSNAEISNVWGMGCTQEAVGTKNYCNDMCGYTERTKLDTGGSSATASLTCKSGSECYETYIDSSKGCSGG